LDGIVTSTLTPTLSFNSVDNPVNPTTGKSWLFTTAFTGGPLGGNVNTLTQIGEYKQFRPMNKRRNVLGYRVRVAYTTGFGGKEIPPYSRFYMGGEDDLRGFDIRSVSPVSFIPTRSSVALNVDGGTAQVPVLFYTATLPGGDAQAFGNVEYRIPIVKQYFQTALFFDGGTSGVAKRNGLKLNEAALQNNCDTPGTLSLTCQFPNAGLKAGLPIAPGTNFRLRGSAGIEFVIQLPIVQAPFRIYYAYNVHRLHERLVSQQPFIEAREICEPNTPGTNPLVVCPAGIDLGRLPATLNSIQWFEAKSQLRDIINNPGALNYFEPKTTFRFTVSRTF
jgi:outer membrane protein insertion porin family